MRNASHCSQAELCSWKERHHVLQALLRTWTGLGRARAKPGMGQHGKIPSPTLQPEAAWTRLGVLPLAQMAESCQPSQLLSLLRRTCTNQLLTRNLCPCELMLFPLWIKAGLIIQDVLYRASKGISSHFGSSQIFRRARYNESLVLCEWRTWRPKWKVKSICYFPRSKYQVKTSDRAEYPYF